jgi:hypothetical protein
VRRKGWTKKRYGFYDFDSALNSLGRTVAAFYTALLHLGGSTLLQALSAKVECEFKERLWREGMSFDELARRIVDPGNKV